MHDLDRGSFKGAISIGSSIDAAGDGVASNGQNIAIGKAGNCIIVSRDFAASTRHRVNRISALLLTIIDGGLVLHRDCQGRIGDREGAEVCSDLVVGGLIRAPIDFVSVLGLALRGLGTGDVEGDGLAGAKGDFAGSSRLSRCPRAADVGRPVAVIQGCAFALGELGAIIDLGIRRSGDGQRQRLNDQEAVTSIERDRIVRIAHHGLAIDGHAGDDRSLRGTSHRIRVGVLFGDQRAIRAIQSVPDRVTVLFLEQSFLTAGDRDIRRLARIVIKVLLAGVREADVEGLAGVIVRATGASAVGVPLVGADANVYADRLNRQAAGHVDDAIVLIGRRRAGCAQFDLSILRRCSAGASVRLRPIENYGRDRVATGDACNGIIRRGLEAALQFRPVIGLGLVVGKDDQFLLIVDIDDQFAFVACDLIDLLRRVGRAVQVGMMIHKTIGGFVQQGEGVALFDIGRFGIVDLVVVHVEIVDLDLRGGIGNILEGDHVVFELQLQFLGGFRGLVVAAENIRIRGLGCQVIRIHIHSGGDHVGGGAGDGELLGFRDLNAMIIPQDIVDRVSQLIGNGIIIEGKDVLLIIEGKTLGDRGILNHVANDLLGILRDLLIQGVIRIGHHLVRQQRSGSADIILAVPFIIMNGIAQRLLLPMGVEGDILRYLLVPVVRGTGLVRRGEPTLEDIAILGGIFGHGGIEAVFIGLGVRVCGTAVGIEADRAGGEGEIAVEDQTGGHLGLRVIRIPRGLRVLRIRVPALPVGTFHGQIGDVAGQVAVDIAVQRDLLRADQCTVIVIEGQRIL